jgi:hypothetical protein
MKHQDVDFVILLTSTIKVRNDVPILNRSNTNTRLSDYQQSLAQWMDEKNTPKLVFCENSGYDLSSLEKNCRENNPHQKEIEFISFVNNNYPIEFGKGYGEMNIIEYALKNSRLIHPDSLVIKITGRLYIAGIGDIIKRMRKKQIADCYCNMRGNLNWAQSYIFCATVSFIKEYLLPRKHLINDQNEVYFEHVLARAVHASLADGKAWSTLPGFLNIKGFSASSGDNYSRSIISQIKGHLFYHLKIFVMFREG